MYHWLCLVCERVRSQLGVDGLVRSIMLCLRSGPVVLPVLAPLLAVHAVVLMTPLRLLSNLVGDRTPDMYHSPTPPSSSQTGISGGGQPDLPASGDEVSEHLHDLYLPLHNL